MSLEADIEAECFRMVKRAGGRLMKLRAENDKGRPDRFVALPGGLCFFCEFKRPGETPSKLQLHRLKELRDLDFVAEWVDSVERFIEVWNMVIPRSHRP